MGRANSPHLIATYFGCMLAGGVIVPLDPNSKVHAAVIPPTKDDPEAVRKVLAEAVRNANSRLAPHQRVSDFSVWPGEDFPRTNTMKIKRYEVQADLARREVRG